MISIIIPMFNEEKRILPTLTDIDLKSHKIDGKIEVVLVDDGSQDETATIVKDFQFSNGRIKKIFISCSTNKGKGMAIRQGIRNANGEVLVLFDADNSTSIDSSNDLKQYSGSFDVVIGSRYAKGSSITQKQSLVRRLISRFGNSLVRLMLGLPYNDTQCGFKMLKSQPAKKIIEKMTIDRWGFDIEMLTIAKSMGYKIKEAPVSWKDSSGSQLRAGRAAVRTLGELMKIWWNKIRGHYR